MVRKANNRVVDARKARAAVVAAKAMIGVGDAPKVKVRDKVKDKVRVTEKPARIAALADRAGEVPKSDEKIVEDGARTEERKSVDLVVKRPSRLHRERQKRTEGLLRAVHQDQRRRQKANRHDLVEARKGAEQIEAGLSASLESSRLIALPSANN